MGSSRFWNPADRCNHRLCVATGPKFHAVVMAAGAGLLLGSVAYNLIEEAPKANSLLRVAASFFLGSAVFVIGDLATDRMGAAKRKNPNGEQADGASKAIVMGSVLDGIPESFVLGFAGSIALAAL